MTTDERRERPDGERAVPQWQAPPPRRDALTPTGTPATRAPSVAAPPPAVGVAWADRLAPLALGALLVLVAALAAWPALRAVIAPPPVPTIPASPTTPRPVVVPPGGQAVICFGTLTLAAAAGPAAVRPAAAEIAARDLVELPSYPGRLGSLVDARLVTLDAVPSSFGAPSIQATQAAAVQGRAAWLLSFVRTPPLDAPFAPPSDNTAYFLYALVDAATGGVLQVCGQAGAGAEVDGQALPAVPPERLLRQPLAVARSAVLFPVRAAAWLPFTPLADAARVNRLPDGHAEVVADYFAANTAAIGARVRLISTAAPPLLATTDRGGTPVPLAAGGSVRFDDLATLQVLTWREGATWYQVVAARPRDEGPPYTRDELLRIVALSR